MSRLAEFRHLERQIAQHSALLESLKSDPGLSKEIEFESKLKALLGAYGKGLEDIVSIIEPGSARTTKSSTQPRRARRVKTYRNPLTGEVVQSKGGNNKTLGAWKAQFGHAAVEEWAQTE